MPVQYDQKVLKPKTSHNWTQEMVTEYTKSAMSPEYFMLNHCVVPHPTRGLIKLDLRKYQIDLLNVIWGNQKSIVNLGRQVGKSTICGLYCLWYAMFSMEPVNIFILANKARNAQGLLDDIKIAYEEIAPHMKRGIVEYNKTAIEFDNRSVIQTGATTKDSIRSESISFLLLDEFAHVANHIAAEFYQAALPTISTGGKICIISTPKGNSGLFHDIFAGAKRGNNGFKAFDMDWREVPRIDEDGKPMPPDDYRDMIINSSSLQSWNQEYEAKFLGSSRTLIEGTTLEAIGKITVNSEPMSKHDDWDCWAKPLPNHIYVMGVDVAKGTGNDYSVMQIIDITNKKLYKQVAVYSSNQIDPFDFADKVAELGTLYNNAFIIVESNVFGHEVCRKLYTDLQYENLYREPKSKKIGIRCTTQSKGIGTSFLRSELENKRLMLFDDKTYKELCGFIEVSPDKYQCEKGVMNFDDRVMALVWACYFVGSPFWKEWEDYIRQEVAGLDNSGVATDEIFEPVDFDDRYNKDEVWGDELTNW